MPNIVILRGRRRLGHHPDHGKSHAVCHSLLHLLHILKTDALELLFQSGKHSKVTGGRAELVRKVRDSVDAHLCQVARHHNELMGACVVLVQVPLARFYELWPFAAKSLH